MGFGSGMYIVGSTTSGGSALRADLETLLTAHSNWSQVDDYTTGTYNWHVWKNAGTGNDWGQDFYVGLMYYPTNSTLLYAAAFETYNAVTHQAGKCVAPQSSNAVPNATDSSFSGTTLTTLPAAVSSTAMQIISIGAQVGVVTRWWANVTRNGMMITTNHTSNGYSRYIGLFNPAFPSDNVGHEFPLCMWTPELEGISSGRVSAVSRRPRSTYGATYYWSMQQTPVTDSQDSYIGSVPTTGTSNGGGPQASRVAVHSMGGTAASIYNFRGIQYDMLRIAPETYVSFGDTVQVNSNVYWYTGSNIWFKRDAL